MAQSDLAAPFSGRAAAKVARIQWLIDVFGQPFVRDGSDDYSKIRRKRQHGFLNRNASKSGRGVLRNRRRVGRKRLTPV